MSEAIVGILGTVIGTILGWGLNTISNSIGKIEIEYENVYCTFRNTSTNKNVFFYENPDAARVNMQIRVSNFKGKPIGLNGCEIRMEYQDKTIYFLDLITSKELGDNLDELKNIPAYYTKTIYFNHDISILSEGEKLKEGFRIIMLYHINGKKKEYKKVLFEQKGFCN